LIRFMSISIFFVNKTKLIGFEGWEKDTSIVL